jgi:hypothetical protein
MLPRPFHRWKSFWLGVLVLIFLGWAWVRSIHCHDVASWGEAHGGRDILLSQRDSRVLITWNSSTLIAAAPPGFSVSRVKMNPRSNTIFPRAITWQELPEYPLQTASFAHWFLILLFLIPWTAFLLWRARRLKHLARPDGS